MGEAKENEKEKNMPIQQSDRRCALVLGAERGKASLSVPKANLQQLRGLLTGLRSKQARQMLPAKNTPE